jgi:multidrug efflux system membrane fusion protein
MTQLQPLRAFPRPRPGAVRATSAALLVLACTVALASCSATNNRPRNPRVPVTVAPAQQRDVPFALASTGTVEPIETASVGSQVGGVVTRIAFHEGDEVKAGQVLFELDARPFRAARDQAAGTLARDRAQAENARLEAERAQKLLEQNLLSKAEWDQKRATADALAATVQADAGATATAALNLHYATIRAPISGRSGRFLIHVGDYVKAATSDPLVTIVRTNPVRVRFTVPESDVPLVQRYRTGHPRVLVRTKDVNGFDLEGALVFVDNAVEPTTGTLLLKGEFANPSARLVAGQFVDVRLVLYEQKGATVVPAPAVTLGQQGAYVYVLNADSTVTSRPVTVERTVDEVAVVTHGLRPGETVITDGQLRLAPGARVLVRHAARDSA